MLRSSWTIVLLQIILYFCGRTVAGNENLLSTVVLYRHGDRAPIRMYKNDPYADQVSTIWPDGLGQLTQLGKQQQWALGKWLRERYDGFLPTNYNHKDILVQSSDVDRCLMSASSNLAGLYPPEGVQVWNPSLPWQPIPIHTRPQSDDAYLAVGRRCRKYDDMYDGMMYGEYFQNILEENKELFEHLSVNSGNNISDFASFRDLYDNLYIETVYDLTLPEWTNGVFPDQMSALAYESWKFFTRTPLMGLLRSGPLIDQITTLFENIAAGRNSTQRFLMLSAHDSTIAYLLNSLNVFEAHWPQYTATVILELRLIDGSHYVNILYKNSPDSDEVVKLTLDGCEFNCKLDQFQEIVKPIRAYIIDWEVACSIVH